MIELQKVPSPFSKGIKVVKKIINKKMDLPIDFLIPLPPRQFHIFSIKVIYSILDSVSRRSPLWGEELY